METIGKTGADAYTTIRGVARSELRVKKSRFFGRARSVASEQQVADFLAEVKQELPGATHYCYGFSIGSGARSVERSSDDGEPANSAGKPILSAVQNSGMRNIVCVVVRYFGGIKLGIGGLIRAYGQTARDCLENSEKVVNVPTAHLRIEMPYCCIGAVVNLVSRLKGKIVSMDQKEKAIAVVRIRQSVIPLLAEGARSVSREISISDSK